MDGNGFTVVSFRLFVLVLLSVCCLAAGGCAQNAGLHGAAAFRPHTVVEQELPDTTQRYSAEEHEAMGDRAFQRGDLEHAFLNYEKALKLEPANQDLRCKRAWVLLGGNFNDEAAEEFKTVLSKRPHSAAAREGLGQAYFQMKRYERAVDEFQKALALDADRWRSRNYMGIIYNHTNKPLLAIEEFTAALAVRPDSGILYNNLGMAYTQAGMYEEAFAAYQKAYELGAPREKTLTNLGIVLAKMGRIAKAEDIFKEVGNEAQAYNNLGCVYFAEGDYEMAVKSFETAVRASPEPYGTARENLEKCRKEMN